MGKGWAPLLINRPIRMPSTRTWQISLTLLAGTQVGEGAVSQEGQLGQAGAQNTGYIDLNAGNQQALQINNAAAARASGYLGKNAAINGMVDDAGRDLSRAATALYA